MANNIPPPPQLTSLGFQDPVWGRWFNLLRNNIAEAATSVVITTANGFSGSTTVIAGVANITLSVTASGLLKGVAGGIVSAVAGTDYTNNVQVTAPITNSGTAVAPNIGITKSDATHNGYLSSTDWTTFNNKLSGNQTITLSGDATGSGTTAITVTLANTTVVAGTYGSATTVPQLTVDSKGRLTGVTNVAITAPNWTVGNTASRPGSPSAGAVYFDTTIGQPIWYSGSNWVNAAGVVV